MALETGRQILSWKKGRWKNCWGSANQKRSAVAFRISSIEIGLGNNLPNLLAGIVKITMVKRRCCRIFKKFVKKWLQ